uniref:transcription factor bHLH18-like n=1 Tax=Erigeron canadensis TaxID=72917 RepID=UPI001CB8A6F1|nr:transcription factor bHLH18-like [Erigeron canadensis]XP_043632652.1 transcription factor bHLH18-like [Erigeron canadensis]
MEPWLPELEMQDHQGFMNQYQMNRPYHPLMEDFSVDSFSSESYTETPPFLDQSFQTRKHIEESPIDMKQPFSIIKANSTNNKKFSPTEKPKPKLAPDTPNTFTISFGDIKPKDEILSFGDSYGCTLAGSKKSPTMIRNPIQVQDHVLAERKRREKLAQRFVSLSSLLPDLKKMDKATVLEDAASYIQELQSRVKELEGISGLKRRNMQESDISAKRSRLSCSDEDGSSSNETNFEESSSPCDPEIEVRTSECSLLVEIYSRKNCVSIVKVLSEMQKFGLAVISCSTMPFADTTLLITIVAQKNDDFIMPTTDLVKNLQLAIRTGN